MPYNTTGTTNNVVSKSKSLYNLYNGFLFYKIAFMDLKLFLGPMKSGKSYCLINYFMPLLRADKSCALYQSIENVRDEKIWSRNGVEVAAKKVATLAEVIGQDIAVIGVDELHMFPDSEGEVIKKILAQGTRVVAAGLNRNYQGKTFTLIRRLLEFEPNEVSYLKSTCDICRVPDATHTQILDGKNPVTAGLPTSIPDDGTYIYKAVCQACFVN